MADDGQNRDNKTLKLGEAIKKQPLEMALFPRKI